MSTSKTPLRTITALLVVNLIWAGSFPATAIAMGHMSAIFLTTIRLGTASLLLFPLLKLPAGTRWDWQTVGLSLLLGLLGFTAPVYLETKGLALSTPAMAAVSISLEPLFTVLLVTLLLREKLSIRKRSAFAVALVGSWAIAGFPRPGAYGYAAGDVLLVLAVFCYALYNVFSKYLTDKIPARAVATATMVGGFLTSLPLWISSGSGIPTDLTRSGLFALVYLSLLATAGAYLLWVFALQSANASVATLFLYLQPVFGVLLSVLIVGVHPTRAFYLGTGLILFGIYLGRSVKERGDDRENSRHVGGDIV